MDIEEKNTLHVELLMYHFKIHLFGLSTFLEIFLKMLAFSLFISLGLDLI
jgi:positive regulator of sigma E activity